MPAAKRDRTSPKEGNREAIAFHGYAYGGARPDHIFLDAAKRFRLGLERPASVPASRNTGSILCLRSQGNHRGAKLIPLTNGKHVQGVRAGRCRTDSPFFSGATPRAPDGHTNRAAPPATSFQALQQWRGRSRVTGWRAESARLSLRPGSCCPAASGSFLGGLKPIREKAASSTGLSSPRTADRRSEARVECSFSASTGKKAALEVASHPGREAVSGANWFAVSVAAIALRPRHDAIRQVTISPIKEVKADSVFKVPSNDSTNFSAAARDDFS